MTPAERETLVTAVAKGIPRRHAVWAYDAQPSWGDIDAARDALGVLGKRLEELEAVALAAQVIGSLMLRVIDSRGDAR